MEETPTLVHALLEALREQEKALIELHSRINALDDRLEHLRLEALSVTQATWLELSDRLNGGKTLARELQRSAGRIKMTGLLLLEKRLPDKAARLGEMASFLDAIETS